MIMSKRSVQTVPIQKPSDIDLEGNLEYYIRPWRVGLRWFLEDVLRMSITLDHHDLSIFDEKRAVKTLL